jgi:hypothetical protein
MEIRPTPDQEASIRQAIDAGRIERPEDAATQAMALWEERERRRAEILARVDEAEAALARGEAASGKTLRRVQSSHRRPDGPLGFCGDRQPSTSLREN